MLEQLKKRLAEIEKAIANTNQSLLILQGHKNEVAFQIGELQKELAAQSKDEAKSGEEQEESLETQVEVPVE